MRIAICDDDPKDLAALSHYLKNYNASGLDIYEFVKSKDLLLSIKAVTYDIVFLDKVLARYIIVDVLQNGGVMAEFTTFYSASESFEPMSIRLINEEKGSYHLTDDAFDFLFRSKEIESELDYSVTRFRMKEYMRRDNYEDALDANDASVNPSGV